MYLLMRIVFVVIDDEDDDVCAVACEDDVSGLVLVTLTDDLVLVLLERRVVRSPLPAEPDQRILDRPFGLSVAQCRCSRKRSGLRP